MKTKSWKDRFRYVFNKHKKDQPSPFMNYSEEKKENMNDKIITTESQDDETAYEIWDNRTANELKEERTRVRIARRIYHYRKKQGLSQATLGKSIGVPQSLISRIEISLYSYSNLDVLKRIAVALDQPLINFLKDDHEI